LELWSEIIGVQLEDIMDVIKNYDEIAMRVSRWTNMADYRINEDESFRKVLNRIINEILYTETVMYKGQEILLLKYPESIRWNSFAE